MRVYLFGIRHHGPGCARALRDALDALAPDVVLVEGPPDAQNVLPLLTHAAMEPPVALLIYAPDDPRRAVFYPFTVFSPEWQALHYAAAHGIPARFIDLPQSLRFALDVPDTPPTADTPVSADTSSPPAPDDPTAPTLHDDPIGTLAAAGYADRELWWEHQIEQRRDATDLFTGIAEAMTALRADTSPPTGVEALREAQMRQGIRAALREKHERIAVVCGAWHVPALATLGPAKADATSLAGLTRVKVEATWIPWTYSRLSYRSGYGAGVRSPGWYDHLWSAPDAGAIRWVAKAAGLLRDADLDAAPANVVEAVRLADTLAALRDLPMPGLAELTEAIQTTLCRGDEAPMRLIREKLEVGDRLGAVPDETLAVPLARDLAAQSRRLRLPQTAEAKLLDLDLRSDIDRARSHLLHRLRLLGVYWGMPQEVRGKAGTFHEFWQLQWQPELAVGVIEANVWGNTVGDASLAATRARANATTTLPTLTALLDGAILAALPEAVMHLLARVRECAALATDVGMLIDALPSLARIARYGNVRETPRGAVLPVFDGLFARALIGLPPACANLDDDAAAAMVERFSKVDESVTLRDDAETRAGWHAVLRSLAGRESVHGRVRGRTCRLLLGAKVIGGDDLTRYARLALSPAAPTSDAAAWIEGVVAGPGLVLLHEDGLWHALDGWLRDLGGETFTAMLPLLRRAFAGFHPPERRQMGEKVKGLRETNSGATGTMTSDDALAAIDRARADRVLPVLATILGVPHGD